MPSHIRVRVPPGSGVALSSRQRRRARRLTSICIREGNRAVARGEGLGDAIAAAATKHRHLGLG